ncbi:MAG: D-alanine--D-alanine ligase [Clostridia bacterium]|nr:D-alanine--D-alanine ligase [Clostridia bacterium]
MKTNVAVFFGGRSVEHEISIISAVQAMGNIDREKYNVIPVYMSKQSVFYSSEALLDIATFRAGNPEAKADPVTFVPKGNKVVMMNLKGGIFKKKDTNIDVCFPIVHGTNCEDGSIQGYIETLGLPYVGCDVMSSALGMDKVLFKNVLLDRGIPTLRCVDFGAREWALNSDKIADRLIKEIGFPLIVKPANLGSSVGISKVDEEAELRSAIDMACSFADRVLVEHAVSNLREINCSVLGDRNDCKASALEEPVAHDKILSYDDKYRANAGKSGSKGMASLSRKLPADLTNDKTEEIQRIAVETFKAIGASGVVRIDFLMDVDDNDKVYVNEINTIPGSLSFYLWEATGVKYPELCDRLIELAFKRQRERENTMFTIDTNILNETSFGQKGSKGKI